MAKTMARAGAAALLAATAAVAQPAGRGVAHPDLWPAAKSQGLVDPSTEAFVTRLLAGMSLEEKVGQMIQADVASIRPDELRRYPLGSVLAGGDSPPPGKPDRSRGPAWSAMVRAFHAVATEPRPGHTPVPLLFGVDAVHGNNNVVGATLFPHGVALGATHDPELIRRVGEATAREVAAAGIDWAFGPTLAVPQDDRWGRTFESYSEDPALVRAYAGAMIAGLQGPPGRGGVQRGWVAASAKHFVGDGGADEGVDQGNTTVSERALIDIHSAGYPPAVNAGIMTVMASFSSWQGAKAHGNRSLLVGVLKQRMGFDGFVVGDWDGHSQLPGGAKTDAAVAFNAGLDMAMASETWRGLFDNTVAQARAGTIPPARVDEAVRRILRVKAKLGLFDPARPWADRAGVLGAPAHRALARDAVARSLVLLKNDGILPLKSGAHVLVAGPAADDIGLQSGGWTLSWQGDGNRNADFPNAQSIYAGIAEALRPGGGTATLSVDGRYAKKPDAAVVVFGEAPYAETDGDVRTLEFQPEDKQALALLRRLKAAGVPTVSVFLSGRPLWVNPEINQSNAFVAAWLPGSEGGGIADVLIGDAAGRPRRDFTGTLAFSWPKHAGQFTLNHGQPGYDPLFPLGHGLSYAKPGFVPRLDEASGPHGTLFNTSLFFVKGHVLAPFAFTGAVARRAVDGPRTPGSAVELNWPAGRQATVRLSGPPVDLTRDTEADILLQFQYRVDRAPTGPVRLSLGAGSIDASSIFTGGPGWRTARIKLKCFRSAGADVTKVDTPFALSATGPFSIALADLRLATVYEGAICPGR